MSNPAASTDFPASDPPPVPHASLAPLGPLTSTPVLIDLVYSRLRDAIADLTLSPGERIRQAELADSLGVSRQPVSHALQLLKRDGLVCDSGRQGLAVAPIDANHLRELYQVRTALDGLAARLAATRMAQGTLTDAELRRLQDGVAAGMAMTRGTPVARQVRVEVAFHSALHDASGNPLIAQTVAPQWPHIMRAMAATLGAMPMQEVVWHEHGEIVARIAAGDATGAEAAAREHTEADGGNARREWLARLAESH
ncbi:GntR family transcriptional regulator [Pandoraea terrigena]|uniref:HTH-type transcriptional regulator LutR n=1 Tax=Pandoraea terrigena TaxID=2508292 RepID=A0A5E4TN07_9BURK|nr:GntR family transcriptional regulator [Pandoraea terrigena]VVD89177.1 HTH-type transcriptional regulator LutR [Pandoraea terrigena]